MVRFELSNFNLEKFTMLISKYSLLLICVLRVITNELFAQDYPTRPVRLIIGAESGGAPDTVARLIAHQLTVQTGQSFYVDSKPGATGNIGSDFVAKAIPDGYTLLVTSAQFAVSPSLYKLPFNIHEDFLPITNIATGEGFILLVNNLVKVGNVKDLISLIKTPGSNISYSSPGHGNPLHLAGALFGDQLGVQMIHVPYKSGGAALTALLSGQVQVMFGTSLTTLAQIQAGKLHALAYTGASRAIFLPNVPTIAEEGLPGAQLENMSWYGILAPAKLPYSIALKIHRDIFKAIQNPIVKERLETLGLTPLASSPEEFKSFLVIQIKRYSELIKIAGVKSEQ